MEYQIYGRVTLDIDFDIKAESEQEAKAIATGLLQEYYRVGVRGAYHREESSKIEIEVNEYAG